MEGARDQNPRSRILICAKGGTVASARALLLVAAPPAGVDVGCVVPVHQARGGGHPARRDDRSEALHGRGVAVRLSRVPRRSHAGGRPAPGRVATVPGARDHQRGNREDHRVARLTSTRASPGSRSRRFRSSSRFSGSDSSPRSARALQTVRAGHRDHGCRLSRACTPTAAPGLRERSPSSSRPCRTRAVGSTGNSMSTERPARFSLPGR